MTNSIELLERIEDFEKWDKSNECEWFINDDGKFCVKSAYLPLSSIKVGELYQRIIPFKCDVFYGNIKLEEIELNHKFLKNFPDEIYGNVHLKINSFEQFNTKLKIHGSLYVSNNESLSNLNNCPEVGKHFLCSTCSLKSLKGLQEHIYGNLTVSKNNIVELDYLPSIIDGNLDIANNPIKWISNELLNKNVVINGNLTLGTKLSFLKDMIPKCWKIKGKII